MSTRNILFLLVALVATTAITVPVVRQEISPAHAQSAAHSIPPFRASHEAPTPKLDTREMSKAVVDLFNIDTARYPDSAPPNLQLFTAGGWRDFAKFVQTPVLAVRADATERGTKPGKIVTVATGVESANLGEQTAAIQIPVQQTIGTGATRSKTISVLLVDMPRDGWRIQSVVLY